MKLIRSPLFQRAVLFVLGCVCLIGGLGGYQAERALQDGVPAAAEVLGRDLGRDTVYDIRFTTAPGVDVVTKTSFALSGSQRGDRIAIVYDRHDPTTVAQVGSLADGWVVWAGWLAAGSILVAGSLFARLGGGPRSRELRRSAAAGVSAWGVQQCAQQWEPAGRCGAEHAVGSLSLTSAAALLKWTRLPAVSGTRESPALRLRRRALL